VTGASALFTQDVEDDATPQPTVEKSPPFGGAASEGLVRQTYAAMAYMLDRAPTDHSVIAAVARMTVSLEKKGFGQTPFYFPYAAAAGICSVATELKELREGKPAEAGEDDPAGETAEERAERIVAEGAPA
jgi:hypothetical protein